jgi:hypothetical protein
MSGEEAEVSGVGGGVNEVCDCGACAGEFPKFAAGDEEVERGG